MQRAFLEMPPIRARDHGGSARRGRTVGRLRAVPRPQRARGGELVLLEAGIIEIGFQAPPIGQQHQRYRRAVY